MISFWFLFYAESHAEYEELGPHSGHEEVTLLALAMQRQQMQARPPSERVGFLKEKPVGSKTETSGQWARLGAASGQKPVSRPWPGGPGVKGMALQCQDYLLLALLAGTLVTSTLRLGKLRL